MNRMSIPTHHKQTTFIINGREITCDVGIAEFVRELNENGFETCFSCQGADGFGNPYVVTAAEGDFDLLKSIVKRWFSGKVIACTRWDNGKKLIFTAFRDMKELEVCGGSEDSSLI